MTKHDEPLKWVSEARVSLFDDEAMDAIHNNIKYLAEKLKTTEKKESNSNKIAKTSSKEKAA